MPDEPVETTENVVDVSDDTVVARDQEPLADLEGDDR